MTSHDSIEDVVALLIETTEGPRLNTQKQLYSWKRELKIVSRVELESLSQIPAHEAVVWNVITVGIIPYPLPFCMQVGLKRREVWLFRPGYEIVVLDEKTPPSDIPWEVVTDINQRIAVLDRLSKLQFNCGLQDLPVLDQKIILNAMLTEARGIQGTLVGVPEMKSERERLQSFCDRLLWQHRAVFK
jgi:hypothetical protein